MWLACWLLETDGSTFDLMAFCSLALVCCTYYTYVAPIKPINILHKDEMS